MKRFFEKIHKSPHKIACVITGGGGEAASEILRLGGASGTVLYFHTPYDFHFSDKYLGQKPEDGYASEWVANQFATKAYQDALQWKKETGSTDPVIGMGCTSSLGKIKEERKGREHKIFIAYQTETHAVSYSVLFPEWLGRDIEEKINSFLILAIIGDACNVKNLAPYRTVGEIYNALNFDYDQIMDEVILSGGKWGDVPVNRVEIHPDSKIVDVLHGREAYAVFSTKKHEPKLIMPTSMNPLHQAHLKMASIASELVGEQCCFELSLTNADKPPISYFDIHRRTAPLLAKKQTFVVTNASTFLEKARIFGSNVKFAIGIDTAKRICDSKYCELPLDDVFAEFKRLGVKFICFAREIAGKPEEFKANYYPDDFTKLVTIVSKDVHCSSISSTDIRKRSRA